MREKRKYATIYIQKQKYKQKHIQMQQNEDILAAFDLLEETSQIQNITQKSDIPETSNTTESFSEFVIEEVQIGEDIKIAEKQKEATHWFLYSLKSSFVFLIKYLSTSLCIFGVLMVAANYSAYWNLAYSIIYAEEMEITKKSLIQSVAAASLDEDKDLSAAGEVDTFKQLWDNETEKYEYTPSMHSISRLTAENNSQEIDLSIEITPYENRIIIPTIWKNIPLIDIKQTQVEWIDELNDIFMEELENGVIRYPGSAKPGEDGNSFIFGHSSNFPWMEWDYNDVFALLDHVTFDDEVVVYYGQEKHTYKIRTKNVISPGDVSVLKNNGKDKSKLTLMTCWPIGTTLNRLVLTGELISVE